eukprot:7389377-Prymnesium_polylepis.2
MSVVLVGVIVVGVPAYYTYLLLCKHQVAIAALRRKELRITDEYMHAVSNPEWQQLSPEERAQRIELEDELNEEKTQGLMAEIAALPQQPRLLTAGYEMRVYWFELFECVRKILLVGIPGLFNKGSGQQLSYGLIVCTTTFGAYTHFKPFKEDEDDWVNIIGQVQVFIVLINAVLEKIPDSKGSAFSDGMLYMNVLPPIAIFCLLRESRGP